MVAIKLGVHTILTDASSRTESNPASTFTRWLSEKSCNILSLRLFVFFFLGLSASRAYVHGAVVLREVHKAKFKEMMMLRGKCEICGKSANNFPIKSAQVEKQEITWIVQHQQRAIKIWWQ